MLCNACARLGKEGHALQHSWRLACRCLPSKALSCCILCLMLYLMGHLGLASAQQ